MKKMLLSAVFGLFVFVFGVSAVDAGYVNGYYRSNGTYVNGYYRSEPNNTVYDNYSYKGNVNPYTGSYGTKSYDYSYPSYNSYSYPSYRSYNSYYGY